MAKQLLFIQGGGDGAYKEDARLAASLRQELGPGYHVRYPKMPNENEPDYSAWTERIVEELAAMGDGAILVGHSLGASMMIKFLTEHRLQHKLAGIFLIAAPFWHNDKVWHWEEVELAKDAGKRLPEKVPVFLYHGRADEIVPFAHVEMYARALPQAQVCRLDGRNHQLNEGLSEVARDIGQLR